MKIISPDNQLANQFLSQIFKGVPENLYYYLWANPPKHSHSFQAGQEVDVTKYKSDVDLYFGLGLTTEPLAPTTRAKSTEVAGITCLWADIDFGPNHKKNVPPDEKTAVELIKKFPFMPSIVVDSGNGWHAYWLLEEPWIFTDDDDRAVGMNAVKSWQAKLRAVFRASGYDLDTTHDFARVLRVPGTYNNKDTDNPKQVKIYYPHNWEGRDVPRYALNDLFKITKTTATGGNESSSQPVELTPCEVGQFDPDKFMLLKENVESFARTWDKKRLDMPDQSPSSYDMALCNILVQLDWPDSEIAGLIYAFRKKHGHDLSKVTDRDDYIARTIHKAKLGSVMGPDLFTDKQRTKIGIPKPDHSETLKDQTKEQKLEMLRNVLKIPLVKVLCQGREKTQYSVVLELDGQEVEVTIGNSTSMVQANVFRTKIMDAMLADPVPAMKPAQWKKCVGLLLSIAEEIEDNDSLEYNIAVDYIRTFLIQKPVYNGNDWHDYFKQREPFIHNGTIYIHYSSFLKFIHNFFGNHSANRSDVTRMLRKTGFRSYKMSVRLDCGVDNASYWQASADSGVWDGI